MKYKIGHLEMEGEANEIIKVIDHIDKKDFNMKNFIPNETKHNNWNERKKLIIGLVIIIIIGILIFYIPKMTWMQYLFTRALLSLGIAAVVDDLLTGTVDLKLSFTKQAIVKATGTLGIFLIIYFLNPPKPIENAPNTTQKSLQK